MQETPVSMKDKVSSIGKRIHWFVVAAFAVLVTVLSAQVHPSFLYYGAWTFLQWAPITSNISDGCSREHAHKSYQCRIFDNIQEFEKSGDGVHEEYLQNSSRLELPSVDVQKHRYNTLQYLEQNFGKDWRRRPILLKGLWTTDQLRYQNHDSEDNDNATQKRRIRKLSVENLLQMDDIEIPYFYNATIKTITPDGLGSVADIVKNITTLGQPHKIGTQLIVEYDPDLILEVAPPDIVHELFGDYFTPDRVKGSGPWNLFPAMTTVPIFMANHNYERGEGTGANASVNQQPETSSERIHEHEKSNVSTSGTQHPRPRPFTTLHCEPIGNIAVQLSGRKKWTFVQPEHSFQIKPGISPDGRAFFASWADKIDLDKVPKYEVVTAAGDAVWVPTWTWHQVDYIPSEDVSLAASLFHFRVLDFYQNNPLFALLMIPAMVKELLGFNTQ